jgi:HSP20 family protein
MKPGTVMAPSRPARRLARRLEPESPFDRLLELWNVLPPIAEETLAAKWTPTCDIYETEKEVVVKAELPGLKKEDVQVSIDNNLLSIHGERKFEEETKKENYYRVERSYGEFLRTFTLPAFVDATKINAEFKDGILTLNLPKKEEAKPKQIEVKVK